MSYHEIEVQERFTVRCLNCNFGTEKRSAGQAEDAAREHIEAWEDTVKEIRQYHQVEIIKRVLIGRQL